MSDLNNSEDEKEVLDQSDNHVLNETTLLKKDKVDNLLKEFMKGRTNSKVSFKKVGDRK